MYIVLRTTAALLGRPHSRPGLLVKILCFRDCLTYMTLFLTSERDFVESNKILRDFGEATGAKVNVKIASDVCREGGWEGNRYWGL